MTIPIQNAVEAELERTALDVPEEPFVQASRLIERPAARFALTFVANVTRAGLSFVTGILVARALGAAFYGNLNFLLGSFAAVTTLLDAGSTSAFYTLLSSRRRPPVFFVLYFSWTFGVQFLLSAAVIAFILPRAVVGELWLGHDRGVVLLSFAASFVVSQTWNAVAQMGEAARKTATVQAASVCQAIVHLVLIVAAIRLGRLSVPTVLTLVIVEYLLSTLLLAPRMLAHNLDRAGNESIGEVFGQFVTYCRPIVVYCFVMFGYQFADRWFLQRFGGSVQQGFFAVGQQFSMITLMAATSIVSVFWKEIAEAQARGDHEKVSRIYHSVRRFLYFGASVVSCALIPYSREILHWTVGGDYEAGALALALMFLYPIHQTLGYVQGTFYLAVGDTRRYTLIGILMMAVSIPLAYVVVAPRNAVVPGLALGAVGIALKMVVLQLVAIVAQMLMLRRSHGFETNFFFQGSVVFVLLTLAFLLKLGATAILANVMVAASVATLVYVLFVAGVMWRWPGLSGIGPERLAAVRSYLRRGTS
ncbi:MAG: lipopolysaccharide biosynthesis protein [Acidobacteriota bacterium]